VEEEEEAVEEDDDEEEEVEDTATREGRDNRDAGAAAGVEDDEVAAVGAFIRREAPAGR